MKVIKNLKLRQTNISNTLGIGNLGSGKNYALYNFIEEGATRGYIKPYFLWVNDWKRLTEVMTFLIPSVERIDRFKKSKVRPFREPPQFPVRVYMPISEDMPKFGYKGFIVPFTVSADKLNDESLRILFANRGLADEV